MTVRPRRVVHVMNGAAGGAALTTLDLIAGLADVGIESSVVCHTAGADHRDLVRDAVEGRVLFTPLAWWNRKIRSGTLRRPGLEAAQWLRTGIGRASAARVADFVARHDADLVHTNTILTPEGAAAARRLGLPHVWHVREMVGPGHPFRFWAERRRVARRVGQGADVVIANSHAAARCLGHLGLRDLVVVHNGLRLDDLLALPEPAPRGRTLTVGMVANLTSAWKRHDLFIGAAGLVDRSLPLRFELIGGGEQTEYADSLRALAAGSGVTELVVAGAAAGPCEAMARLDVVVHPCPDESFGRIVVEAMAAARPVVGVTAGGVGELVEPGRTGLLAEPGDVAGIAAAIERLARDRAEAARLGRAGRERALASYTVGSMTAGVLAAYETAMGAHRSR